MGMLPIHPLLTIGLTVFVKVGSTGQINTILTFYEITEPEVESPLSGIPLPLLRKIIGILGKTNRAQVISTSGGEGVRLFEGSG